MLDFHVGSSSPRIRLIVVLSVILLEKVSVFKWRVYCYGPITKSGGGFSSVSLWLFCHLLVKQLPTIYKNKFKTVHNKLTELIYELSPRTRSNLEHLKKKTLLLNGVFAVLYLPFSIVIWSDVSIYPPFPQGFVAAVAPFNFTAIGGNLAGTPALMVSVNMFVTGCFPFS